MGFGAPQHIQQLRSFGRPEEPPKDQHPGTGMVMVPAVSVPVVLQIDEAALRIVADRLRAEIAASVKGGFDDALAYMGAVPDDQSDSAPGEGTDPCSAGTAGEADAAARIEAQAAGQPGRQEPGLPG